MSATLSPVPRAETKVVPYQERSLDELASSIRASHNAATQFAGAVLQFAKNSLDSALAAGRALLAAKDQVPHGEWGTWLKEQVPGLSPDQAQRYMKVVREIPHVRISGVLKTVRQAYIACGTIKKPVKKQVIVQPGGLDKMTALKPSDFVSRFRSLRVFMETASSRLEFEKFPEPERIEMAAEIRQIIEDFQRIQGRLGKVIDVPTEVTP